MLIYGYCPGAWVGVFSLAPAKKSVSGSTTLIWRKLTKRIGSVENLSAKNEITFFFYLYFCMFLIKVLDQNLPNWIRIFGTDPDRKNCVSNGFFSESGSDFSELGSKLTINVDPVQILKNPYLWLQKIFISYLAHVTVLFGQVYSKPDQRWTNLDQDLKVWVCEKKNQIHPDPKY